MEGSWSGKAALVTGASSGIGRATALALGRQGARLSLVGRRVEALDALVAEITATGGEAQAHPADLLDDAQRAGLAEAAVKRWGRLDLLVNAAGIIGFGSVADTTLADFRAMVEINLTSVFDLMQRCLPALEQSRGAIINVSSVTGLRSFPGVLAYAASKAAVDQLTRCAALELAAKGVRVSAVNPGVVVTGLHRSGGLDAERYARFLTHSETTHPMGRVGQPEEVAEAILFLASAQAGWITGVTLPIDGGRHLTCAR